MHHYEPLNDKQDLECFQREQTRLVDRREQFNEKSREIDRLFEIINK
jgi:hypothetical protein